MSSRKRNAVRRDGHRWLIAVALGCAAPATMPEVPLARSQPPVAEAAAALPRHAPRPRPAAPASHVGPRRLPVVNASSDIEAGQSERGLAIPADWIDHSAATELEPHPDPDAAAPRKIASPPNFPQASASLGSMRSITADTCGRRAAEHLDDAYREYSVGAWASAEASAWKAMERIAIGLDVAAERTKTSALPSAAVALRDGRRALREARDFVTAGAVIDAARMEAIAASHQTPV